MRKMTTESVPIMTAITNGNSAISPNSNVITPARMTPTTPPALDVALRRP